MTPYNGVLCGAATATRCAVWITDGGLRSLRRAAVPPTDIDRCDAGVVLAARWPFGDAFPGLAPPLRPDAGPAPAVESGSGHLALVPVARPADVPAALGWSGCCGLDDVAGLCAVLRSWEDRFRAFLVRIDLVTLWLSVAAPPLSDYECDRVAAEHAALCGDVALRARAGKLRGARRWRIGWG